MASSMFKNLTDFSYKRNLKEALGFYISYLVFIVLLAGLLGVLGTSFSETEAEAFNTGILIGATTATIACVLISFLILKQRKLLKRFDLILLALISGIIAYFFGSLGGLIPVTFLTTMKNYTEIK